MALIVFLKPTMVGKSKLKRAPPKERGGSPKRGPPKERGSPIQGVPPPTRRRESPRRSGSSVQDDYDDRILPTSPPPVNEKEIVNIQVSPNDPSLHSHANNEPPDSQANNEDAGIVKEFKKAVKG